MGWVIRLQTDADIDAVAAAHVESWQAAYRGIFPADFLDELSAGAWAERARQRVAAQPSAVDLVAWDSGQVEGFVVVGPHRSESAQSDEGELYALYVRPASWGAGLGFELHAAGLEVLRHQGFRSAVLWVLTDNALGRAFYARQGWVPDGAIQVLTIGGTEVEELRLRLSLS